MVEAGEDASAELIADPLWDDWDTPPRVPAIPELHLTGFDGPLDLLLDLAERERIDLSRISVTDMVDQFVAAMARYDGHVALERRADWLNLAARLLLLRSRLCLPNSPEAEKSALGDVERERGRLQNLQFLRAATAWLDARPQLGRDVFARSTLDVADTSENGIAFGDPGASRGESAFPQLRFVALVENGTHVLFGAKLGHTADSETTLAHDVVHALRPSLLCLADRYFC